MKKAIVLMAVVLFSALAMGQTTLTLSDYWVYWMTPQGTVLGGFTIDGNFATRGNVAVGNDLTVAGDMTLSGALGITGDLEVTGDFAVDGATVVLDGSTSVRGISAGFVSLESTDVRFGANATEYMKIAVVATTGATTISHTGTTPTVSWTANSFGFTGATSISGNLTADGTVHGIYAPNVRIGYSSSIYTDFAVDDTTGNLTITHTGGTTGNVDWTAASFGFTGDTTITGDLEVDGAIYHTGATNSGALMVSSNTVEYTDTTEKNLFVLPANAIVTDVVVVVTTACNGDGTHQLSVGVSGETTKWVNALDVKTSGVFRMGSSSAMPFAGIGTVGGADVTVIGSIPAGGTSGNAGSVTVYIYWYLAP